MKVKLDGKEYYAKKSRNAPYVFIYKSFIRYIIDDLDLDLSWRYFIKQIKEDRKMDSKRLLIDFKPEVMQLMIAEPKPESKEVTILNVIKGKEALDLYDILTGGKKND